MIASLRRLLALRPLLGMALLGMAVLGMAVLGVPVVVLLTVGLMTVFAVKALPPGPPRADARRDRRDLAHQAVAYAVGRRP